eukprot:PhM_4_TR4328/c0_g1_i1/m.34988
MSSSSSLLPSYPPPIVTLHVSDNIHHNLRSAHSLAVDSKNNLIIVGARGGIFVSPIKPFHVRKVNNSNNNNKFPQPPPPAPLSANTWTKVIDLPADSIGCATLCDDTSSNNKSSFLLVAALGHKNTPVQRISWPKLKVVDTFRIPAKHTTPVIIDMVTPNVSSRREDVFGVLLECRSLWVPRSDSIFPSVSAAAALPWCDSFLIAKSGNRKLILHDAASKRKSIVSNLSEKLGSSIVAIAAVEPGYVVLVGDASSQVVCVAKVQDMSLVAAYYVPSAPTFLCPIAEPTTNPRLSATPLLHHARGPLSTFVVSSSLAADVAVFSVDPRSHTVMQVPIDRECWTAVLPSNENTRKLEDTSPGGVAVDWGCKRGLFDNAVTMAPVCLFFRIVVAYPLAESHFTCCTDVCEWWVYFNRTVSRAAATTATTTTTSPALPVHLDHPIRCPPVRPTTKNKSSCQQKQQREWEYYKDNGSASR